MAKVITAIFIYIAICSVVFNVWHRGKIECVCIIVSLKQSIAVSVKSMKIQKINSYPFKLYLLFIPATTFIDPKSVMYAG